MERCSQPCPPPNARVETSNTDTKNRYAPFPVRSKAIAIKSSKQPKMKRKREKKRRRDSKDLVTVLLGPSSSALPLPLVMVASIIVLLPTGLIGHLGDDVGQEVQDLIFRDSMFQMGSGNAFRIAVLGFLGSFGDKRDHEEF